jgi:hypothetical protein
VACPWFIVSVAGGPSLPAIQLCLQSPKLPLQARPFLLLPFGPLLYIQVFLALPLEIVGQLLALLP